MFNRGVDLSSLFFFVVPHQPWLHRQPQTLACKATDLVCVSSSGGAPGLWGSEH